MGIFNRQKRKSDPSNAASSVSVQTAEESTHPFTYLSSYTPLYSPDDRLYKSVREGLPIIDSAITKIIRLMGGFEFSCGDENADEAMKVFFSKINVGGNQQGIQAFVDNFMSQLLTYGSAIGEMVADGDGFYALYNAKLSSIEVKRADNGIDLEFYPGSVGATQPFEHQERILYCVLNPEPGEIRGTSLLKGLPFISDILLKIYNTIGTNWQRVGNLRYAVTYKPQGDGIDKAFAKERAQQMANAWRDAMSSNDAVKDFVAVGDVKVSVIGADNQVLDSDVPVRQMLEQIIAKTGLMPYMFGLSWSTSERMSQQQADILTTELKSYRRIITPTLQRIAETYLQTIGIYKSVEVAWTDITLQDETETAQARYLNAQADKLIEEAQL